MKVYNVIKEGLSSSRLDTATDIRKTGTPWTYKKKFQHLSDIQQKKKVLTDEKSKNSKRLHFAYIWTINRSVFSKVIDLICTGMYIPNF